MVTIGYGTQDTFFNECGIMAFLITVQSLLAIFLDSVFIGLVFSRLGRAQQRAASVVFSDKAVIQQIDGQLHFMFQVTKQHQLSLLFAACVPWAVKRRCICITARLPRFGFLFGFCCGDLHKVVEIRDQAFVEASVRCIALRHIYDPTKQRTVWFQHSRMRLQQPDDERDSLLFMALPSTVVHRIDRWSPFMPPASWDNDHRGIFNEQEDLRQFAAARNRASQGFSAPEHNPLRGCVFVVSREQRTRRVLPQAFQIHGAGRGGAGDKRLLEPRVVCCARNSWFADTSFQTSCFETLTPRTVSAAVRHAKPVGTHFGPRLI